MYRVDMFEEPQVFKSKSALAQFFSDKPHNLRHESHKVKTELKVFDSNARKHPFFKTKKLTNLNRMNVRPPYKKPSVGGLDNLFNRYPG
jgi:hypothetical protein